MAVWSEAWREVRERRLGESLGVWLLRQPAIGRSRILLQARHKVTHLLDKFRFCAPADSFSSIQTWALEEARRRLEAEGILEDPEQKK